MSLTIADYRVDKMHEAIVEAIRALDRLKRIERDLAEIRTSFDAVTEALWDGTYYDPEGERRDA